MGFRNRCYITMVSFLMSVLIFRKIERFGLLLRFLNANLFTYETAYKDFFYAYGFEILIHGYLWYENSVVSNVNCSKCKKNNKITSS